MGQAVICTVVSDPWDFAPVGTWAIIRFGVTYVDGVFPGQKITTFKADQIEFLGDDGSVHKIPSPIYTVDTGTGEQFLTVHLP